MTSTLIIASAEKMQPASHKAAKELYGKSCMYVSLAKSHERIAQAFKDEGIPTSHMLFVDCVEEQQKDRDVIHIPPERIDLLSAALHSFVRSVHHDSAIIVDSLSTLLIYHSEHKVAQLVKQLTDYGVHHNVRVVATSQKKQGDALLNDVYNFFDEVHK